MLFQTSDVSALSNEELAVANEYRTLVDQLLSYLRESLDKWNNYITVLECSSARNNATVSYQASIAHTGRRERPKFDVSREQVEYLVSLSFQWTEIAALLCISRMTLYRRRAEFGMLDLNPDISNQELRSLIIEFKESDPNVGVSMAVGLLRARGFKVTRARVRDALQESDPLRASIRWPGGLIRRCMYSVPGPNSLWHIDSHHKLIRWRLVTHGGIDGFSRLIVFLRCASNIKSITVYQSFLEAVNKYHLPSRVRTDQGMENILVVEHMLEHRGAGRQSAIVGSSVHNQRIERLWRDMHKCVT
ncbi:PREDICTED: uncharacterized protein LOC109591450, partial [Amphimedon queenslandica]|uniref:Integrase catalytic domain-containing protein n=2 Tax=Amphimedon queenslandica TaxID=400682 RepID=A0AAN0JZT2_AMPQE